MRVHSARGSHNPGMRARRLEGGSPLIIDLNCDLGEGAGTDADLLPLVPPQCLLRGPTPNRGGHHCHSTWPLSSGGGRRSQPSGSRRLRPSGTADSAAQCSEETYAQILAARALAEQAGVKLQLVKPHGGCTTRRAGKMGTQCCRVGVCGSRLAGGRVAGSRLRGGVRPKVGFIAEVRRSALTARTARSCRAANRALVADRREAVERFGIGRRSRRARSVCAGTATRQVALAQLSATNSPPGPSSAVRMSLRV